jgi:hypothetical protein
MANPLNFIRAVNDGLELGLERLVDGKYMTIEQARDFLKQVDMTPESLTDREGNPIPFRPEESPEATEQLQYFRGLDVSGNQTHVVGAFYCQKTSSTKYEELGEGIPQPTIFKHPRERYRIRTRLR